LSADLTPYELRVLRSHRQHARRESELPDRQAAQKRLSKLGYIHLEEGVYRITPAGMQILENVG
jgi:hypothetical protein